MQSDDEAPLTLSKWPFYLGDILLVLTALAIAILGKWQLTNMQVVSCVLAVALGAAIFVLPYVVEYLMRVREVSDDRESELRMLRGHLQQAESALMQYHERLKELESGSGSVDQRCELLASAVDQKLLVEAERVAELSQQLAAISSFKTEQAEALAAVKSQIDGLREKAQGSEAPSEAVVALQAELVALETRLTQSVEALSAIETFKTEQAEALAAVKEQVEALNAKAQNSDAPSEAVAALQAEFAALEARLTESVEPLSAFESRLSAVEGGDSAPVPEEERPTRSPRQRRLKSDSGLLHRAIQVKQDSASSAVSRIIDSKSKLVEPEQDAALLSEPEAEEAIVEVPVVKEEPAMVAAPELVVELDPEEDADGFDSLPDNIEVSLGADLIEDDELLEADALEAEQASKLEVSKEESEESPIVEDEVVVEVEPPETASKEPEVEETVAPELVPEPVADPAPEAKASDLFGEVAPATARRARTKADDAIFSVSILIGIGNKPFLRGSGGGLSWESGVAMEFEEIGKWRWVAPADMEAPIELQVFRNDEDGDRKGRYTLKPGQKLEVSPVF
ncbi:MULTISPECIES: hypothetical protein [unclassified Lentimonas]|uniref:hypothetical protein n=1 Tax=unclassified Lentimonas TaxID=2630993 RepID=UPI001322B4EE|nr:MULTISPECIES: hypothetical protein [unclassified Lentimonas]CAA6693214.1 Unannotated [Lentimonas sp. CC10]CAA6695495.1 Unannotated [Lentimonas sp. CC19]CAA7071739.1 Unannotated [Lentimonas sp. CC11]